jgi:hypothetical protein
MLTNISDFTLSRVKSKFDINKPEDTTETFSSDDFDNFDLLNVFETVSNRVKSRVQQTTQVDSANVYRNKVLDMPSLDLIEEVVVANHVGVISQAKYTEFKANYFPGWEPIITSTGGRIYSARRMTDKQRAMIQKRLENLNKPKTPSFVDRTRSFLFPSNDNIPVKGFVDTTEVLKNSSFQIYSFHFSNGSLRINLNNGICVDLETFLRCYAVNNSDIKELFTLTKNLLFRGIDSDELLSVINPKLLNLKRSYKNICFDKSAISQSKLLKSRVSECQSLVKNYVSKSTSHNPSNITSVVKDIIDLTSCNTVQDKKKSKALECVDFFLSTCVEGVLEAKSGFGEKFKSNFLFHGFQALKSKGSIVQDFAYWIKQYALNPTNRRVKAMFNEYYMQFKKQISLFLSSNKSNAPSLISSLCTQLVNSIKK